MPPTKSNQCNTRDRCKVDVILDCELLPSISSSASPVNIATFNKHAHISNLPVRVTLISARFRATISESTGKVKHRAQNQKKNVPWKWAQNIVEKGRTPKGLPWCSHTKKSHLMHLMPQWTIHHLYQKLYLKKVWILAGMIIAKAHYREQHSSMNIYQPGGVTQITLKPISNRVASIGSDKLGWWAKQEIRLDGTWSLFIYTSYQPCKAPANSKKTTTWDQQVRTLIHRGITDPDPRKQFYINLTKELNNLKREGHIYIIGLDMNSRHDDNDVLDFLSDNDLVDLFDDFYYTRPPTYTRSENTMDMILGSIDVLQWTTNAYILDLQHGPGDHSVIGLNLNYGGLIGREDLREIDQTAFQSRLLTSTDLKVTKAYLEQVSNELEAHNICNRFHTLIEWCDRTDRCSDSDEDIFQQLCKQLYDIAKRSESNCKRVGPKPWSTTLASVGQTLQIAQKEFFRLTRRGPPEYQVDDRASNIARAKENLAMAKRMVTDVNQHASALRETGLQLLTEQYAEEHNASKETALKQLLRKERLSQIYKKLGSHVSGKYYDPLKCLLIPDDPTDPDNTTWTALLKVEAIWEALLHQGRAHFSQASDTPFATGPIADKVGPFEQNEFSDKILQGTFDIDSLTNSIEVRDIVKGMSYQDPSNLPEFDCTITVAQLKEQFKSAKESTASSPNGLHYGHWKTLLWDDDIFFPFASMISFAFKWGVPPKAWETAVQSVLEKDQGSPKITWLRWIVLLDAAMNMGFRIIFGHRMMKMATKMGLLSPYQFGSRSGHNALGCVLLKRLSYDTALLLVALLCVFDNDATACFDRMIPSQCMTLGRRIGVQEGPVRLHLKISKRMKYHIKTAYGIPLDTLWPPSSYWFFEWCKAAQLLALSGPSHPASSWPSFDNITNLPDSHLQENRFTWKEMPTSMTPHFGNYRWQVQSTPSSSLWMLWRECGRDSYGSQVAASTLRSVTGMLYLGNGPRQGNQAWNWFQRIPISKSA